MIEFDETGKIAVEILFLTCHCSSWRLCYCYLIFENINKSIYWFIDQPATLGNENGNLKKNLNS